MLGLGLVLLAIGVCVADARPISTARTSDDPDTRLIAGAFAALITLILPIVLFGGLVGLVFG